MQMAKKKSLTIRIYILDPTGFSTNHSRGENVQNYVSVGKCLLNLLKQGFALPPAPQLLSSIL